MFMNLGPPMADISVDNQRAKFNNRPCDRNYENRRLRHVLSWPK